MPKLNFDVGPDKVVYGPQGNQTVYETTGLGGIVAFLSALFAAVIIVALLQAEWSAVVAIVSGGLYFGLITMGALLVLSGTLAQVLVNRQEQITLRRYHELQYKIMVERPTALPDTVDPLQLPSTPSAEQLPGPLGGTTFVPAEDMTTARDAMLWAVSLYGSDGSPDPSKVHLTSDKERPGRLRVKAPAANMRAWLTSKKVLEDVSGGVRLRIERYPDVQTLRSVLNG
jgi:hypothetical protein